MAKYSFFGSTFPAIKWVGITPDDDNDIPDTPRSVYIGSGGNLVAVDGEGNEETFFNVPDGSTLPIQPLRIKATNTTATNIIALY